MKAEIITYETKDMTNSQRSIISKKLFGFKDRTKGSKYTYERKGILELLPHIVITKKTFVVSNKHVEGIKRIIKKLGANVKSWKIEIPESKLKKRCG